MYGVRALYHAAHFIPVNGVHALHHAAHFLLVHGVRALQHATCFLPVSCVCARHHAACFLTVHSVRALHHAACSGPDTYIVHGAPARQFGTRHHNAGHLNKDDWRHRGMKKGAA